MATTSVLRTFGPDCAVATATRWKWALLALVAVVGCIDVWALSNWRASIDPDVHGTLGIELALPVQGWQKLRRVDPQSPLRAAGATVGDEVRIRPGDAFLRDLRTDETIRVELRSSTGVRALDVQPVS
ncbi:MAG TPA: hypothetical protein VMU47_23450, partial [Caldimonas sp.]|nr:hypothetical protein [Caldimonas sp.]